MEAGSITEETAQAFALPTLYQALGSREEVSVGRRWLGRFSDEVIIKGMANTGLPSISAWCAEGQAVWRFVSPLTRGSGNLHAKPLHGGVGMIWDVASGIGRCRHAAKMERQGTQIACEPSKVSLELDRNW